MLRASSLGLHFFPTAVPISLRCPRATGVTICRRLSVTGCKSSALHLSLHSRQAGHDTRVDTESLRSTGAVCPVGFSSSVLQDQPWPMGRPEDCVTEEVSRRNETVSGENAEFGQHSATGINLHPNSTVELTDLEFLEVGKERGDVPPLNQYVQEVTFLSGRPWARQTVKPLRTKSERRQVAIPSPEGELEDAESVYLDMLHVLATTSSVEEGWEAYGVLSKLQQQHDTTEGDCGGIPIIPFAHLHRLARVIARNTPKTRAQFLRLLSVLTTIQNYGGVIHLHEWNALIDHAGKGWRKSRPEDFYNAMSIYYDMIHGRPPGSRFSDAGFDDILSPHLEDNISHLQSSTPTVEPDIYTYTTLIDIAARTGHPSILHRATTLLKQAKIPPNRITHLSLLKFFTAKKQYSGVRVTLAKMKEQNLELGVDGLNACMWGASHNNRIDVVMMIYRILRHNMVAEEHDEFDDIASVREKLSEQEGIVISPSLRPNEITFTLVIQTMAYHGNLLAALSVFIDMLSTPNVEQGAPLILGGNDDLQPALYSPTIHVFRAVLIGFFRHGTGPSTPSNTKTGPQTQPDSLEWNLPNLKAIFEKFLELPPATRISESTVFWIFNSFSKTSGHDVELLQTVWQRMEDRFGSFKGGPNHRLTRWRRSLFPEAIPSEDPD